MNRTNDPECGLGSAEFGVRSAEFGVRNARSGDGSREKQEQRIFVRVAEKGGAAEWPNDPWNSQSAPPNSQARERPYCVGPSTLCHESNTSTLIRGRSPHNVPFLPNRSSRKTANHNLIGAVPSWNGDCLVQGGHGQSVKAAPVMLETSHQVCKIVRTAVLAVVRGNDLIL